MPIWGQGWKCHRFWMFFWSCHIDAKLSFLCIAMEKIWLMVDIYIFFTTTLLSVICGSCPHLPPSTCLNTSSSLHPPPGFCGTELLEISFAPIHLDLHLSKFCARNWGSSWTSSWTNPCVFPRSCDFLRWAHRTQFKRNQVGRHAEAMNWEMSSEVEERPRLLAQTDDWISNDVLQPETVWANYGKILDFLKLN